MSKNKPESLIISELNCRSLQFTVSVQLLCQSRQVTYFKMFPLDHCVAAVWLIAAVDLVRT